MSELRNQLQNLRDEYRAARYPGDLASDVLAPSVHRLSLTRVAAAATVLTALAAAVMVWMSLPPASPIAPPTVTEELVNAKVELDSLVPAIDLAAMPAFPTDLPSLVPAPEAIEFGSMPALPAIELTIPQTTTLEESA